MTDPYGHEADSEPEDQLQPEDSLIDRGVDDALDEGYSPPEKPLALDDEPNETLDDRLAREEPETGGDPADGRVEDPRSGRLVAPEQDPDNEGQRVPSAEDVGIDGGAASAEEAAVHVVDPEVES
ncbi:DUF5709 domain-containing protein [Hoyosella altamirensis]|uniref:DUF5709 domain-containing protein n=1 Tax=Hoyosella altamirensis TaxID=616997 RepID=A0A839RJU3_9ACTN|nr:DUF5709 domain-containing protein [Hoyosella altamirensis]MBB3036720.1 hypothetical protein [Hoyosella altamirensis]